jgi:hypothetical protein
MKGVKVGLADWDMIREIKYDSSSVYFVLFFATVLSLSVC